MYKKTDSYIKGIGALMYEGMKSYIEEKREQSVKAIREFVDFARDDNELTRPQICKIVGYGEHAIKKIERGDKE